MAQARVLAGELDDDVGGAAVEDGGEGQRAGRRRQVTRR